MNDTSRSVKFLDEKELDKSLLNDYLMRVKEKKKFFEFQKHIFCYFVDCNYIFIYYNEEDGWQCILLGVILKDFGFQNYDEFFEFFINAYSKEFNVCVDGLTPEPLNDPSYSPIDREADKKEFVNLLKELLKAKEVLVNASWLDDKYGSAYNYNMEYKVSELFDRVVSMYEGK